MQTGIFGTIIDQYPFEKVRRMFVGSHLDLFEMVDPIRSTTLIIDLQRVVIPRTSISLGFEPKKKARIVLVFKKTTQDFLGRIGKTKHHGEEWLFYEMFSKDKSF
jgi:hypothetical protein